MPGSRLSFQPALSPFFLLVLPRVQLFLTHSLFLLEGACHRQEWR